MRRLWLTSWALALLLQAPVIASAQVDAQIAQLNSEALEAYQALDIDTARGKLEQAIGLAQQSGMVGPPVAQTYVNLGIVYVAGMNDRDQGLTAFVAAMCMQPDVQLDPLLSTPDVQQVFAQAQQDAQSGACGPAGQAPPGAMPMQPVPGPGVAAQYGAVGPRMDVECPPGVKCDTSGEGSAGPTDFARGFFGLQLVEGLALVRSGMKADSKPKDINDVLQPKLLTDMAGNPLPVVDTNHDNKVSWVPDDPTMQDMAPTRYYFDPNSAWVPDADSFDDYEDATHGIPRGLTPLSTKCAADGKRSGPTPDLTTDLPVHDPKTNMPFTTNIPSSYCVRVEAPGFVPNLAIRFTPGYFITQRFALSLPVRIQFSAGKGSLSHFLIGLRGELLFSKMDKATGVPISWFFGTTIGQIQAKPPPKDPSRPAPFAISGPYGVNTGMNFRFRIHRNFGFIVSPEFDLLIPNLLFNIDLAGGVEGAF